MKERGYITSAKILLGKALKQIPQESFNLTYKLIEDAIHNIDEFLEANKEET